MTRECPAGFLWCQDSEDFPPPCSSPFALNSNLAGGENCGLSALGGGGGAEEGGGEKENKGEGGGGGKRGGGRKRRRRNLTGGKRGSQSHVPSSAAAG